MAVTVPMAPWRSGPFGAVEEAVGAAGEVIGGVVVAGGTALAEEFEQAEITSVRVMIKAAANTYPGNCLRLNFM